MYMNRTTSSGRSNGNRRQGTGMSRTGGVRKNSGKRTGSTNTARPQKSTNSRPATAKRNAPKKSNRSNQQRRSRRPQNSGNRELKKNYSRTKTNTPKTKEGVFRMIPIGGCEEVGRNMTFFEYNNDIIVLDMGLQFPEDNMPGIDYIVPNIKYLKQKGKRVRAVVFSHGHLDHIGAAPLLLEELGYPPIIALPLTTAMIKHRQEDYKKGSSKNLKNIPLNGINDVIRLGDFTLKFFQVEHSIMDSMGTIIQTPVGAAIHPGDWTMEREEDGTTHVQYDQVKDMVEGPSVLMLESLGALKEGRHQTHEELYDKLYEIVGRSPGRTIVATFGSQVERVKWLIQAAKDLGKKVALDGYSMKKNIEIAKELGYVKPAKHTLIDIRDIDDLPEDKVVIVCTGAQGEENAVLNRIVTGQHRHVKLRKQDTVIFSSSVIPGNERSIQKLKDNIYRQCDNVIHGDLMDVHVSGHGTRQDIVEMVDQVKPDYYVPVYANYFFLKEAKTLVTDKNNFDPKKIFVPDNGTILELDKSGKLRRLKEKAPADYVFVDGLGVSDSQHVVLRDRQVLAEDGMVVVIATIDSHTGRLVQNPDIISRGFVFLKDNRKLIEDLRKKVKKIIIDSDPLSWTDTDLIRNDLRDKLGQFVFTKTEKRPMILPVVIEV